MDQAFIPLRSKILLCLSYLLIALSPPPPTLAVSINLICHSFLETSKGKQSPKNFTHIHRQTRCMCICVCVICKHCCCCYQTTLIRQVAAVAEATLNQRRVGVPRIVYNKKSAPTVCSNSNISSSSDSASGVYC